MLQLCDAALIHSSINHTTGEHKNLRFCFSNPLNFHLGQAKILNYKDAGGGGYAPPAQRGPRRGILIA